MRPSEKIRLSTLLLLLWPMASPGQGTVNDLRSMGYVLFPAPQQVNLGKDPMLVDGSWQIRTVPGVSRGMRDALLDKAHAMRDLSFQGTGSGRIILQIETDVVSGIADPGCAVQAYRINIQPGEIHIAGNSEAGLFYGIQSFIQLLKPEAGGWFSLPRGTITDWPDLELRIVHWDTKHHRDKLETLKRYLDWLAYFKVNAVAFEIEDKYEYPSHPVIGGPTAFTREEMHELTAYARERHIHLIPDVQAPAHMAYVLKHPEFAHLRADAESNYQSCLCDEEAVQLILDMYQDMINATPGVPYFLVSTDEIYYAGICSKCDHEYNDQTRSQAWVDYLNRVNAWMQARGRRVLAWVEYPLLQEDISQVSPDVINGIMSNSHSDERIDAFSRAGLDNLSYSSMQGSEYLFPNYFPTIYRGRQIEGRLRSVDGAVASLVSRGARLIGTFAAAWDDSGLHNETFWLGWATVTQYAWTKDTPKLEQSTADFMDLYYGHRSFAMVENYLYLEEGARFYEALWDRPVSTERARSYGNSEGKGIGGHRYDQQLKMPSLPAADDLGFQPSFRDKYQAKIEEAERLLPQNDLLISRLMQNLTRVDRNRYNLEVLLAIATLERYTMETVVNLAKIEDLMVAAAKANTTAEAEADPSEAVNYLADAWQLSGRIIRDHDEMWSDFQATWYKSRLEKNMSVGDKHFLHVYDDVKDHLADRRKGLDYMLAPFQRMRIPEWRQQLLEITNDFARHQGVPVIGTEAERLED